MLLIAIVISPTAHSSSSLSTPHNHDQSVLTVSSVLPNKALRKLLLFELPLLNEGAKETEAPETEAEETEAEGPETPLPPLMLLLPLLDDPLDEKLEMDCIVLGGST